MFQCTHCIYQGRGQLFPNCSWFEEKEEPARRPQSSGLRPRTAGPASPGGGRQPQAPAGAPSGPRPPAAVSGCPPRAVQKQVLAKAKGGGGADFRALTPAQPPGFLVEDAKELGANEVWEEVRKSMEDADNTVSRVTLPLPVGAVGGWEGLAGRFGEGQWSGLPCAVLLTNTGYPGWAGKVHAGCTSDLDSTWEFQRVLRASTLHCINSGSMCRYGSHTHSPAPPTPHW